MTGMVFGAGGNFYDTTILGGSSGFGTVFKVTASGTFTTLANFPPYYGSFPGGLTLCRDGSFYGTTYNGGSGDGKVFRVTTNGTLTTLANLTGIDAVYATGLA